MVDEEFHSPVSTQVIGALTWIGQGLQSHGRDGHKIDLGTKHFRSFPLRPEIHIVGLPKFLPTTGVSRYFT